MTHALSSGARLQRRAGPSTRTPIWASWVVLLATATGLAASIWNWSDRHSGIAGEPGTALVIASCAMILVGLAVTERRGNAPWVNALFNWLILLATVLTGVAGLFLMSWTLAVAMLIATLAQLFRMFTGPG